MSLIFFVSDVLMLALLYRFMATAYHYRVDNFLLVYLWRTTDPLCRPLQRLTFGRRSTWDFSPLVVIVAILLFRGLMVTAAGHSPVLVGEILNFVKFVQLLLKTFFLLLLFSLLLTKSGIYAYSNTLIRVVHDVAFSVFRAVRGVVRSERVEVLFAGALLLLWIIYAAVLMSLNVPLFGWDSIFPLSHKGLATVLDAILICNDTLGVYVLLLVVDIAISWVSPNPDNQLVQFLSALCDPFLNTFRRWAPWAQVGILNLSPMLAIGAIYLAQSLVTELAVKFQHLLTVPQPF